MGLTEVETVKNLNLLGWAWKHKLLIVFLIFTIPLVISSIVTSIQENNYSRPFVELGLSVINADYTLNNNVEMLRTNQDSLVGMVYPSSGIYQHAKYYWLFFWNVIWKILSEIFLIIIPFTSIYFIANLINNTSKAKNIIYSLFFGIVFIFIINLLITIVSLVNGSIKMDLGSPNQFLNILNVILLTLPFHGIYNLVTYIISLFI